MTIEKPLPSNTDTNEIEPIKPRFSGAASDSSANRVKLTDVVWFQEGPGVRNYQYTSHGVKLLNVANLHEGKLDTSNTSRYISDEEAYGRYKHFLVDEGDLIVASSGIKVEYFNQKMGFADKTQLPLCMNTSTIRFKVRSPHELDINYFMCFLKSDDFKHQLERQITGSAQLNFGPSHLKRMSMPLPPLAHQLEVAERIAHIDKQIDDARTVLSGLDNLVKSRFVEMFGDLENGYKCPSCELCSVAEVGSSKRVFKSELLSEGVPFYRGTEIADLSAGKSARPNLFISKKHYEKLIAATGRPEAGDLLLPSICPDGQIWCVNTDAPFYFKDGRVLWIRPNREAIDGVYLRYALSTMFQMSFSSIASGTTFAELKIFLLKGLSIPLPNLKTQKEFASFVSQVDKLRFKTQQQIEKLEMLKESLMQEYFG